MRELENPYCLNAPNQLSDIVGYGVWKWFWGALDDNSIEAIVTQIANDLNYNEGAKCYPILWSSNCYKPGEVEKILLAYANLVERGKCEEYTGINPNAYNVIKVVSDGLSTDYKRVQKVLNMLLWGTKNGRYKGGQYILLPKTNSQKTGLEEVPQIIKDNSLLDKLKEKAKDTVDTSISLVKWLTIGGCVVGGLYVLNMVKPFLPKGK